MPRTYLQVQLLHAQLAVSYARNAATARGAGAASADLAAAVCDQLQQLAGSGPRGLCQVSSPTAAATAGESMCT